MQLSGIHHITAVSARIVDNVDFYTQVLGLRLVKKSVNQDDVSAYHLFYADKLGSPRHRYDIFRLAAYRTKCTWFRQYCWYCIPGRQPIGIGILVSAFLIRGSNILRSRNSPGGKFCRLKILKVSNCIWSTTRVQSSREKFGSVQISRMSTLCEVFTA